MEYHIIKGKVNADGTFLIPVTFSNPATNDSIEIQCMVDTGASHIVLADERVKELNLMFGPNDMGTTTIADGKRAVGPVHNLVVSLGVKTSRPKPTLMALFSRGAHSLIGMSYLSSMGVLISCSDGSLRIPSKWEGSIQTLREGIQSDILTQGREKEKYANVQGLRTIDQQREHIDEIVRKKNVDAGTNQYITMLCIEELDGLVGRSMGCIGPVPWSVHNRIDENYDKYDVTSDDIRAIESAMIDAGLTSADVIGTDMGTTSYY